MKCDELKRFDIVGKYRDEETMLEYRPDSVCYDADEVDVAIDELKQKLHDAEMAKDDAEAANTEYREDIRKLKAENERLKSERDGALGLTTAGITLEDLTAIAKKYLNETKRALWLARAERAVAEQTIDEWSRYREKHPCGSWRVDPFEYWVQAWIYVEKLCRKKAEEYK